jgi:hypothetical protein
VRNQRNKFVALIAAASQASVEMGDRLKLLASEQEILAANLAAKAKLLTKVRSQQQHMIKIPWYAIGREHHIDMLAMP